MKAHSRWRRTFLFVAVVWSIAGAFVAVESGMVELADYAASHWLSASIVLPKQSEAGLRHCQEVLKGVAPPVRDAVKDRQDWYAAWTMGLALGYSGGLITRGRPGAQAEQLLERSRRVAVNLKIPPPGLPEHGRSAYEVRDFHVYLEEDPPCVAAALEFRYSSRYAAVYRLGAAVGFINVFAQDLPELGDTLSAEIRAYGTAASIPEELWRPLMEAGHDAKTRKDAVNRLDAYNRAANPF